MADALSPLLGAQGLATRPDLHVALSASAGTGKTHVLSTRVYRLLLNGAAPHSILCLTFTKAGASEMARRINERLAAWVQMSDAALANDLKALDEDYSPPALAHARCLFARVLEATGGGLAIQTIHSFCQHILASFPMEAGLIPGFRPLEDREQADLRRETLAELILMAEQGGDERLLAGVHALSERMGPDAAENFLYSYAPAHDAFAGMSDDVRGWLFDRLDLPTGDIEEILALACDDAAFDMDSLARLILANDAWGTATGQKMCATMQGWRDAPPARRAAMLDDLYQSVMTQKGEVRKTSSGLLKVEPDYAEYAARIGERCHILLSLRRHVAYAEYAARALYAGRAFALAYSAAKRRAGALDFDDMVAHTAALLDTPGIADWIGYKLDGKIDHILIDEAQDTNALQWRIIEALSNEYFAGEGARGDRARSLFTVGDFKQAIYGFQGTSPRAFADACARLAGRAQDAEQEFANLSLNLSFRSVPAVLDVVDAVIAEVGPAALGLDTDTVRHDSNKGHAGSVMLLRPVGASPDEAGSDEPDDTADGDEDWLDDVERLLAERIAKQVAHWIDDGLMLPSKGHPVRAGDIMILVRTRGTFARLLIARLHEAGVEVAGIDRIRLQQPLAVLDLMAAVRFAAQSEDDLALAHLLVSPLIGWDQQMLLDHAVPRRGGLWRHLRGRPDVPGLDVLHELLALADFVTPYQFLERILSGPMQGRRRLLERLGEQARDAIDELLLAAMAFEVREAPSLQGFVDWFDREQGDLKREAEGQGNAVRLLTVHGAKGLQAPLVILADATKAPDGPGHRPKSVALPAPDGPIPLPAPVKGGAPTYLAGVMAAQAALDREEHWRLLYVALTRAEDHLVLTGALGKRAKGVVDPQSWFAATQRAMTTMGAQWAEDARWGGCMSWYGTDGRAPGYATATAAAPSSVEQGATPLRLPDWATTPAPAEARPSRPLAPTAPSGDDDTPHPPPGAAQRAAAQRGQMLHALFERLPDVAPDERRMAGLRWLERSAGVTDAAHAASLIDHVLDILARPDLSTLFAPGALAEAPIAAIVGDQVVAGTVDRLLVDATHVQVVDFKTGGRVPDSPDAIPIAHMRQMAAYCAALSVIFPDRTIVASLLYTAGPVLFTLHDAMLVPHKPGFAMAQESLQDVAVEDEGAAS